MEVIVYNEVFEEVSRHTDGTHLMNTSDGRWLLYSTKICDCCKQEVKTALQIPANYHIEVKVSDNEQVMLEVQTPASTERLYEVSYVQSVLGSEDIIVLRGATRIREVINMRYKLIIKKGEK